MISQALKPLVETILNAFSQSEDREWDIRITKTNYLFLRKSGGKLNEIIYHHINWGKWYFYNHNIIYLLIENKDPIDVIIKFLNRRGINKVKTKLSEFILEEIL